MTPVLVATVDGLEIKSLPFGGYAVYCFGRLLEAFETIEEAFLFAGNKPH